MVDRVGYSLAHQEFRGAVVRLVIHGQRRSAGLERVANRELAGRFPRHGRLRQLHIHQARHGDVRRAGARRELEPECPVGICEGARRLARVLDLVLFSHPGLRALKLDQNPQQMNAELRLGWSRVVDGDAHSRRACRAKLHRLVIADSLESRFEQVE